MEAVLLDGLQTLNHFHQEFSYMKLKRNPKEDADKEMWGEGVAEGNHSLLLQFGENIVS